MNYRIAMVGACPFPVPQGSQTLLRDTALLAQAAGNEVHLVVYGHGVKGSDAAPFAITLHRGRLLPAFFPGARRTDAGLSFAKPFLDLSLVNTLRRVIRDHAIQIVHAHNYEALFVAMCAGTRPIVYHAHNAMADELPHFLPFGAYLGHGIDIWLPRQADCVIAPHAPLADYLRNLGCRDVEIIPPAIDPDLFSPAPVTDALPPVVYTGNLDAYQNLPLLYAAMRRVRDTIPAARLVIATSCPASIPNADIVPVSDFASLRAVLEQDAVFVCPRVSWSGYPIKLLNAMAAAKPVVCCQSAAHPITHGQNGLAVADNNPEAFAAAIVSLLQNPSLRAQLGAAARQTVIDHHSPAKIASRIHALYSRLGTRVN